MQKEPLSPECFQAILNLILNVCIQIVKFDILTYINFNSKILSTVSDFTVLSLPVNNNGIRQLAIYFNLLL